MQIVAETAQQFLDAAVQRKVKVYVTRTPDVFYVDGPDRTVVSKLGLAIRYSFSYEHDGRHWDVLYDERVLAGEDGLVTLENTLFHRLEQEKPLKYVIVQRSGSI